MTNEYEAEKECSGEVLQDGAWSQLRFKILISTSDVGTPDRGTCPSESPPTSVLDLLLLRGLADYTPASVLIHITPHSRTCITDSDRHDKGGILFSLSLEMCHTHGSISTYFHGHLRHNVEDPTIDFDCGSI